MPPTDDGPSLENLTSGQRHPLGGKNPFHVGRSASADLALTDVSCSRSHFRIVSASGSFAIEPLNDKNPTFLDDRQLSGPAALGNGSIIRAGNLRFRFHVGRDDDRYQTLKVTPGESSLRAGSVVDMSLPPEIPVSGTLTLGRDRSASVVLAHPQVSRRHATITGSPGQADLRDLGSANGTFVNGLRVPPNGTVALKSGDRIDIGPFALRYDGKQLISRTRSNNVELVAREVRRVVTDRTTGKPLTLLDGVNLVIRPHEFVCLLGPSGSGKSTLLGVLSGRTDPGSGTVEVNGQNLHAQFDALKQDIALVPQKDLLHDNLTLDQALGYTARLRLPPDTTSTEARACVDEILETVQLTARRKIAIRYLSGGQVKRASLANEILCKPSLLFLDEVTSGLDEQTDRDMMALFRSLADAGKTVVCVTHSLANVEENCHLVVVLTPGGKLAFVGSPAEALGYFQIERLGDVYARMADHTAEAWRDAFLQSPYYQRYVVSRLPKTAMAIPVSAPRNQRGFIELVSLFFRQALLLCGRSLAIWKGSPSALLAMAGQPLLVALLLTMVYGDLRELNPLPTRVARSESLLFLLAVTSFWLGCNNAAKEMVKERGIFVRERDFSLLTGSYYLSKAVILTAFGLFQVAILYSIVKGYCGPPGNAMGQLISLSALVWAGTALGLLVSAVSPTEEVAVTLIPVAIIPQVVLSSGIAPLSGIAKYLGMLVITTYWGKRALDSLLPEDQFQIAEKADLAEDGSLALALAAIVVHGLSFTVAGLAAQMTVNRGLIWLKPLMKAVGR